jgi:antitoxin HigA-1
MIMSNKMRPIHPGEILKDELSELGISASALAKRLAVPVNRVTSIINGTRAVTADTALRLARFFGTSPEFWLNLQSSYELKITLQRHGKQIVNQVHSIQDAA